MYPQPKATPEYALRYMFTFLASNLDSNYSLGNDPYFSVSLTTIVIECIT